MSGGNKPSKPECPIEQAIPGWKEVVEPYKKDAVFWHGVWQSADRPRQGELKNLMTRTRNQYHYAVRRVKKMANSIRARRLLEASEKSSCALFAEMKKINGKGKGSGALPDTVGGVSGEDQVVEEFRKVYSTLYNSEDTTEEILKLVEVLREDINQDSIKHVDKITGNVVKEAAARMKPNKSDVSKGFTSDAILNAPDVFFDQISMVFRSWLVHGTVTLSMLSCAFLPLFKGGLKDPSMTDRAIAGSSLILKLFENVIVIIWGDKLGTDTLQFGFKAGTSTTECSWLVMEVASYYLRMGTPCLVTLLDCSMAFDMYKFSILFETLHTKELPAIVIRTFIFMYREQKAWVSWGNSKSSVFGIVNGTRQGSVLSPSFFGIYIDDLIKELRKSGVGCYIGGKFFGAAVYPDDLILLAPCRSAMAQMVQICENFGKENNLMFSNDINPAKSKSKCVYTCVGQWSGT